MLASLLLTSCASILLLAVLCVVLNIGPLGSTSGPTVNMGTELAALKASGRIPPGVVKEGKDAFEVVLQKGKIHGSGSNSSMTMRPPEFFPSEACRVKFKLWFDDAFEWEQTSSHKVGGKLGGFRIGNGNSTGGHYSTGGASFRLTFAENRGAEGYLYPALKRDFVTYDSGNPSWDLLDQPSDVQAASYVAMGVHVFAPNRRHQLFFKSGQWNDVEMFCKLNTPGKSNGVMELVINGQRRRLDTVRYRYDGSMKIERFHLDVFFGGGSQEYAPSTDVRLWYADFAFGSS